MTTSEAKIQSFESRLSEIKEINMFDIYDISRYGFLPERCQSTLPENFIFFQNLLNSLEESKNCIDNKGKDQTFRIHFKYLPKYDPEVHTIDNFTDQDTKFMYSILSMIMNRYIWCTGVRDAKSYRNIPKIIGVPLYQVSKKLGIKMSLTHSAVDLWNWHLIDETKPFSLDNIDTNYTMTGNKSEQWFYKVMIAIEGLGGGCLEEVPFIPTYIGDPEKMTKFLVRLCGNISESAKLVPRMYEHCKSAFFFNQLRIYLSGSDNPNLEGIKIDLSDIMENPSWFKWHNTITIKTKGGSAAQSTLIQVYDAILGVSHFKCNFLDEMRDYMPAKHRNYLQMINNGPSIREYVSSSDNDDMINAYDNCINKLKNFRKAHVNLVKNYIVKFITMNKTKENSDNYWSSLKSYIGKFITIDQDNKNAHGKNGSGGTDPEKFCNKVIKNTQKSLIKYNADDSDYVDDDTENNLTNKYPYMNLLKFVVLFIMFEYWWLWHFSM